MKFSTRVNKSYESRLIYDQLEEDNPAVYLLFALCNYIALRDTLRQGKQILEDLKKGIIHEIPNYNVKEVTKIENYIRTGKFKYDMMQLAKNKERIIDLLKAFFDDIMETTTEDLNSKVEALLLELIHRDMVALKPELENHLMSCKCLVSLENTKLFAPYFHISKMLKQEWFKRLRADAKYDDQWADGFAEGFIRSEFGMKIANDWKENSDKIKGYVFGCLKEGGVFKDHMSNDSLVRDAAIISNTE